MCSCHSTGQQQSSRNRVLNTWTSCNCIFCLTACKLQNTLHRLQTRHQDLLSTIRDGLCLLSNIQMTVNLRHQRSLWSPGQPWQARYRTLCRRTPHSTAARQQYHQLSPSLHPDYSTYALMPLIPNNLIKQNVVLTQVLQQTVVVDILMGQGCRRKLACHRQELPVAPLLD